MAPPSPRAAVRRVEIPPVVGHASPISRIAISPSKRLLVTSASDGLMGVWNVETGALLRTIESPRRLEPRVLRVTDEETAVVTCKDGTLRELDLHTGAETRVAKAHHGAFTAVIDRAGRRALTTSIGMDERDANGRQRIVLWDLDRLELVRVAAEIPGHVASLAWSDDGRRALVTTYRVQDGTFLVDLETGKTLRRFEAKSENAVERLAFDASGRRAIVGHAGGPTLVFDTATGKIEQQTGLAIPPFVVGPDGHLLTIEDGLVQRDLQRLDVQTQVGWRGPVSASAWTADRTQAIVAGGDALRLIDTSSGSVLQRLDLQSIADWQAAIAPDGLTVAVKKCRYEKSDRLGFSGLGARIDIMSLETGAIVKTLRSAVEEPCGSNLMFSGGGSRLIESIAIHDADAGLRIWDLATGQVAHARVGLSNYRLSAFPDDRKALLVAWEGVEQIDFETIGQVTRYGPTSLRPICGAVSPDGQLVMVESRDDVRVFDAQSSKMISTFPAMRTEEDAKGIAATAAFSPDGKLLAIAEARSLRVHDPRSGALVRRWPLAQSTSELRFIDARRLATADWEGAITIWDVETGLPLATDTRARGQILDLRAIDGVLINASRDTAVRLIPLPRPTPSAPAPR